MKIQKLIAVILLVGIPSVVFATSDIPMVSIGLPSLLTLLIPIVIFKNFYFRKQLDADGSGTFFKIFLSNTFVVIIAYPLSWLLLLGVQIFVDKTFNFGMENTLEMICTVLFRSAWVSHSTNNFSWMVPMAGIIGLIPFYFISIFTETKILKYFFVEYEKKEIKTFVWKANTIVFSFFLALLIYFLIAV